MIRHTSCFVIAALACQWAHGEARLIESDGDGPDIIRMEVTPADEPTPVFKHRLRLWPHELLPGNAPQWYLRAWPEETRAWQAWNKASSEEEFDAYYSLDFPVSEVPWGDERFKTAVSVATSLIEEHLLPGTRRRGSDWGIRTEQLSGREAIMFLLPEFQASRGLARMANVVTRKAIHERRYEDAIDLLRANYRLGADCGEEPILVCTLVGIAITGIANNGMIDLIAAPDSPNLYWALSELPSPPVPVTEAVVSELELGARIFPFLKDAEIVERSPEEWNALWKRWATKYLDHNGSYNSSDADSHDPPFMRFIPMVAGLASYSHAKERLADWGYSADQVQAMAVGQVLSFYSARVYRLVAATQKRVVMTPFPQRRRVADDANAVFDGLNPLFGGQNREVVPIASLLLPATSAAQTAEVRAARDVAALRVIEALRMHAAQNDSRFPRTLEDITCVPVPKNPATDKPFLYHLDGRTAVLDLPDWEGFPGYSRRYEISIAK